MRVFNTYLYEVSKGTKPAALVTCEVHLLGKMLLKLKKANVSYFVQNIETKLNNKKVNLFFGAKECIDVVEKILNKPLFNLSPFEDFILGSILGYDVKLQCKRLLERHKITNEVVL